MKTTVIVVLAALMGTATAASAGSLLSHIGSKVQVQVQEKKYGAQADDIFRVRGSHLEVDIRNYGDDNVSAAGAGGSGTQGGIRYAKPDVWSQTSPEEGGNGGLKSCVGNIQALDPEVAGKVVLDRYGRVIVDNDASSTHSSDFTFLAKTIMDKSTKVWSCFPKGAKTAEANSS